MSDTTDAVLVVDDDAILVDVMALHLRKRGYVVTTAADGAKGLETLTAAGPFAVLVTDLMMPGMSGLDLLRAARQADPDLEVIVVTAAGALESAIAAMREDGAYDYLLKPLESLNELSVTVERAAARRRLRREQAALQAQVRDEAELLQAVIAHAGDPILCADRSGVVRLANDAAARLLKREPLVGARAADCLPPPLRSVLANWQTVGGRPAMVEVTWPAETTLLISLTPLAAAAGGWVMVLRDVTHLKRLDDLRWHVLTEAASKIRMPLSQALLSLTELNGLLGAEAGRAGEIVYRLVRLWTRIQDWLEEMLALVRVESGSGLRLSEVDAAAAVQAVADHLTEGFLRDRGPLLRVSVGDELPAVLANADLLRQVLEALVRRAAQRTSRGGRISLTAALHEAQVWFEVSDEGEPLPESELPHIFERAGTTPVSETLSLNLAVVKAIVDRMGGQVWVRNEYPLGGVLAVCLPAANANAAAPEAPVAAA
jgi:CheY-like chemotaxis protein